MTGLTRRLHAILAQFAAQPGNRSIATLLDAVTPPTSPLPIIAELAPPEAWGRNERPYPRGRTVAELFTEVAQARPQAVALIAGSQRWSYQELDECANAVANQLHRCGVTRGEHVPLLLPRGAPLIICELGVLKLGAVYVPIDPGLPIERKTRLLRLLRAGVGIGAAVSVATSLQWLPGAFPNGARLRPRRCPAERRGCCLCDVHIRLDRATQRRRGPASRDRAARARTGLCRHGIRGVVAAAGADIF